jgi:putative NADPH-quinone reductase
MMARKILVINGHPDPRPERFAAALAGAYVRGASAAGHQIRRLDVGALDFPLIRSQAEFQAGEKPASIQEAQDGVAWADHLVIIFPLWLGGAPAVLKGFLEQVFRYGFALSPPGQPMKGLLKGRSTRLVVTMGMPALVFRAVFGAFGLRSLERGLLWICGVSPIRRLILGGVAGPPRRRARWLRTLETLGRAGS